ncbi:hypothetical protein EVAR_19039_1 [Eumeta japonica]|uniref:Uncharacterized protein n=1 Tax=Eumeta variegata TaxID=151549 RepID=A0A4C1V723_EUMVA|nr:hypothetical protein EVAR_19039_1 [Eumeta japonica]
MCYSELRGAAALSADVSPRPARVLPGSVRTTGRNTVKLLHNTQSYYTSFHTLTGPSAMYNTGSHTVDGAGSPTRRADDAPRNSPQGCGS